MTDRKSRVLSYTGILGLGWVQSSQAQANPKRPHPWSPGKALMHGCHGDRAVTGPGPCWVSTNGWHAGTLFSIEDYH